MENEKRLIDANALIAELDKFANPMPNKSGYDFLCGIATAIAEIEDAPTVEAEPVVHGRWNTEKCDHVPWRLKNPEKWVICKCSVCGYSNGRKKSNYCPNCGAKMDGGNEDGVQ